MFPVFSVWYSVCWISCIRPDFRPIWYPIHPHCFSSRGPDSLGKSSRMGETALANRVLHTLKLVLEADFNSHNLVSDIIHLEVIIKMRCLIRTWIEYLSIPLPTDKPGWGFSKIFPGSCSPRQKKTDSDSQPCKYDAHLNNKHNHGRTLLTFKHIYFVLSFELFGYCSPLYFIGAWFLSPPFFLLGLLVGVGAALRLWSGQPGSHRRRGSSGQTSAKTQV